jgi:hypothetical protein
MENFGPNEQLLFESGLSIDICATAQSKERQVALLQVTDVRVIFELGGESLQIPLGNIMREDISDAFQGYSYIMLAYTENGAEKSVKFSIPKPSGQKFHDLMQKIVKKEEIDASKPAERDFYSRLYSFSTPWNILGGIVAISGMVLGGVIGGLFGCIAAWLIITKIGLNDSMSMPVKIAASAAVIIIAAALAFGAILIVMLVTRISTNTLISEQNCEQMSAEHRDSCYEYLALEKNDSSFCAKIQRQSDMNASIPSRDACYGALGIKMKNQALCQQAGIYSTACATKASAN